MTQYERIFENNKKWVAEKKATDKDFFDKLSHGQDPDFLYIGCSDSRVTAEEIMGAQPGDVFVYRNIGNIISNTDFSSMSVIDYAVAHLHVKHIVVCGHYDCGGVKAAMQSQDYGILNPWLRNIRDVYRLHKEELNEIYDEDERSHRLVELNVEEQCINVIKTAVVQKTYLQHGYPTVHGWIFDVHSGHLIDLKINFEETLRDIMEIYHLGTWGSE
ncbi:MAG: carbonic anhydrase [Bacteroidales bacterium]|nr:carbonic anhydrase [Bacteroidales bacterium]MCF8455543.1 carbonic anhydrase [Bacteroidales bacterium]